MPGSEIRKVQKCQVQTLGRLRKNGQAENSGPHNEAIRQCWPRQCCNPEVPAKPEPLDCTITMAEIAALPHYEGRNSLPGHFLKLPNFWTWHSCASLISEPGIFEST